MQDEEFRQLIEGLDDQSDAVGLHLALHFIYSSPGYSHDTI